MGFRSQIHFKGLLGSLAEPTTGGVNIAAAKSPLVNPHFEQIEP